ncbi:hypothetical protein ECG_07480 [Echinococcus granulosus]|uniref:Protein tyrosine phosphatase non receptor type n=1 Tax=Echinococcus granulosus TaxID=6210 RepID=A0A068WWQ3_ECHGR|nr:hypothetical protein ECG_07480 [Echinococcus granulosus]CDS24578.1 protein tyrosine phosphatase non receptor type [Echinococcus granulosus]
MAIETRHFIRSRILVNVDIFSRDRMNLTAEKNWTIANIYAEVCDCLGIPESRLFGLARQSDYGFVFLDPEARISSLDRKPAVRHISLIFSHNKQKYSVSKTAAIPNGGGEAILLFLRVHFYVPNHCLRGRVVRHLYYEQLKLNSQNYGLTCSDEVYFQLAAFSIKIYLLARRHSSERTTPTTFNESNLKLNDHFPSFMIESYGSGYLYASIPNLLGPLEGQGRETLEWRFIRLASDPSSNFNLHLYPVSLLDISHSPAATSSSTTITVLSSPLLPVSRLRRSHSGRSSILPPSGKGTFWLGIGPNGFEFHEEEESKRIAYHNSLPWVKIDKLSRKHASFIIHLTSGRKLTFFSASSLEAQHLFTLSSHLHKHQTVAHLASQQSARQLEQQDRLQYNEAYIYSAGEVVTMRRVHAAPDTQARERMLMGTSESPLFPQLSSLNHKDGQDERTQSVYI